MENNFIKVATPQVGEEEFEAVREVLLSGNYVSGAKVEEFEQAFAEYIGVPIEEIMLPQSYISIELIMSVLAFIILMYTVYVVYLKK